MKQKLGIYIHIPFCMSKCYYCNFASYVKKENRIEEYIDCVCMEILQNAEILSEYDIATIYFGGGTPSFIDSKYIQKIMDTLRLFQKEDDVIETTIEVNPNSVTLEKLQDYKACGINRISMGVQSTHNDVLKKIGRIHQIEDVYQALELCKKLNFSNISIDLIYPLPGLTLSTWKETLEEVTSMIKKYPIKHISIYNLEVHEDTMLYHLLEQKEFSKEFSLVDEEEEYQMKENLFEKLEKNGFFQYEISNFSMKGYESKHNLTYWNQNYYLGFGAGAASFFAGTRYKNTENLEGYIQSIRSGFPAITEKEELDLLDLMKEYMILKLRLKQGFDTNEFLNRFGKDVFSLFQNELEDLEQKELIKILPLKDSHKQICLTKRGMEVANYVWEKLI